ncbi:MAG: primosomal protein N' [Cytophagales bacterium]
MSAQFCDVILPLPIPNFYTYSIPEEYTSNISVGSRIVVQFGPKKILTAIVANIHNSKPTIYDPKSVLSLVDESPTILPIQLDFFYWIAQYYMCHNGEVISAALPSGLKLSSESKIQIHPLFKLSEANNKQFSSKELNLLEEINSRESITYTEASSILDVKNIYTYLNSLQKKSAILIFEEIKEKFKPKIQRKIRLAGKYANDKLALQHQIESLEKKPKQLDILLKYLQQVPVYQTVTSNNIGILKSDFLKENASDSVLKTLVKNGIFEEFEVVISRFEEIEQPITSNFQLSEAQQKAKDEILLHYQSKQTVLLHGITGSGKTEVYIELIKNVFDNGQQVLFLLPEIALTTQIVARLYKVFGSLLGVYHSKYSDNERVEVWQGLLTGKFQIVVGVRSAIFLPFSNLGLVIIDEEHEPSYKQYEPAPRYHARDCAVVLAQKHHAKVLLGSATPSVETYHNCHIGKWELVRLQQRYGNAQLPDIELVDMKRELKLKTLNQDFSEPLFNAVHQNLIAKKQTILFQNRRGYSPYIACEDCGFVPDCKSCDVSLTHHLHKRELVCHYCGYHEKMPNACPACGSSKIKSVGFGTEKLEEEAQLLYPAAKIQRMDLDTTRTKTGFQKIIAAVENQEVDILVGTQMVTKGLDFENVSLVGVFDIDRMLHFPDFRSQERVFQLLTQVSGRAGRKGTKGQVIIQSSQPQSAIFQYVIQNNYIDFYDKEISERQKYLYPPFCRLIKITFKHKDKDVVEKTSVSFAAKLKSRLGKSRILGPESPVIDKIRDLYLKELYVKLEKEKIDFKKAKQLIANELQYCLALPEFKQVYVVLDIDPV